MALWTPSQAFPKETLMGKNSAIEWTDATYNPWMGCAKVSTGCKNCYMFRDQKRFGHDPTELRRSKTTFRDPLKWKEPKVVFVCSWSDFFWEKVPEEWRREAWEIMFHAGTLGHTFLLLTKRPENITPETLPAGWIEGTWRETFSHVWLGISAENQEMADLRIPLLLQVPAAVHFVSAEPLLGPIDLRPWLPLPFDGEHLDWVITGGESDLRSPRPMEPEWVFDIRDQCVEAGVAYFHKQHGGTRKINGAWGGRALDGRTWDEFPKRQTEVVREI
jgi:protein gp37